MKTLTGKVISTKMSQTAVVLVERLWRHPLYQKTVRRSKKYLAHNSLQAKEGDIVEIQESRPLSKRKRWLITKIKSQASL